MINLQFQYKPLFKVKALHEYYSENSSNEFIFIPTTRTVDLCKRMSLLVKQPNDEIHIMADYFRKDTLRQFLVNQAGNPMKLSFYLFSRNPYFINITNIPSEFPGNILYFSNLQSKTKTAGNLSHGQFVGMLDLHPTDSSIVITSDQDSSSPYEIMQPYLKEKVIIEGDQTEQGLQPLEEGYYSICHQGKEIQNFVFTGKVNGSPIGFMDIVFTKEIQSIIIESIEDDENISFDYLINFEARKVFWKYVIVPRYLKRVKDFEILVVKGKDNISFKKDKDDDLFKNKIAYTSSIPLKYKQMYDFELQLKRKDGDIDGAGKVILATLPFAPFDYLKPLPKIQETESFYSEIHIYI